MPELEKDADLALALRLCEIADARDNYVDYYAMANENDQEWRITKFSTYLANEAQKFIETDTGNAYDILIIETPPQHGKTTTITETLPSWYLGKHKTGRVIIASYNEETAERFNRRNKEKIARLGKEVFGIEIGLNRATECELTNKKGRIISRGIMSGITGNPANLIIIDDPIKNRSEADSETFRNRVWGEWVNSLKTRLQAKAKVIIIMTPWHEDDLAARIQASETNVKVIRLPVEAEENDPLGRVVGDALCPEFGKDNVWLAQFKESYINDPSGGRRAWQALYMCSPRIEGGNLIHRNWWTGTNDDRMYDSKEIIMFGSQLISVDASFKGGANNDYVSIQVWGKIETHYYLRYCLNRQMDFPQTVAAIRQVKILYPDAMAVLIEDKANGSAIISTLQQEMFCIAINPQGGKEARVNAVSVPIESGHVHLPKNEPWVEEFIDQFTAFPAGKHDDMVDSASQALNYMIYSSGYIDASTPDEKEYEDCEDKAQSIFTSDELYNVYGNSYGYGGY